MNDIGKRIQNTKGDDCEPTFKALNFSFKRELYNKRISKINIRNKSSWWKTWRDLPIEWLKRVKLSITSTFIQILCKRYRQLSLDNNEIQRFCSLLRWSIAAPKILMEVNLSTNFDIITYFRKSRLTNCKKSPVLCITVMYI